MYMSNVFRSMRLKSFLTYIIFRGIHANISNDMIIDYFNFKRVSSVVGFSCNVERAYDIQLIRALNEINIRTSIHRSDSVFAIKLLQNTHYWKIGVFIDTQCVNSSMIQFIFSEAAEFRLYDDLHNWLIITYKLDGILNVIDDRAFGISTDFVIVQSKLDDELNYEFYDVYNVLKTRGTWLNITKLGKWNDKSRLQISLTQSKFNRRSNLHRTPVMVMFFKRIYELGNESFTSYLEDDEHATRDGRNKFGYQIINHLADMYNFTFVPIETAKWEPGDKLGPLARALTENTADIAGSMLNMMVPRTYILKFVHLDWPFRTCFIFRNPPNTEINMKEISSPLHPIVWYLIGSLIIVGIIIFTLALHYDHGKFNPTKLSDSSIVVIGALCQQSSDIRMERLFTRMIFFWMMIFSLLMYNYYSASVVSNRLDNQIQKINDSLNEFTKLRLKVASEWMLYLDYLVKQSDWETKQFYHQLWLNTPESRRIMDPEVGIELVQRGGFAYHLHPEVGYPMIEKSFSNREICELTEVHLERPVYTAFAVPMNSSIVELMRVGLVKISEAGLRYRQLQKWQYRRPQCRQDILNFTSITIEEFLPYLILLATGIILAIVIFMIEMFPVRYDYRLFEMGKKIWQIFGP